MAPKRIQRKRTKGWQMPENTVYVGRPTIWGNPFKVGGYYKMGDGKLGYMWLQSLEHEPSPGFVLIETRGQAVEWYREYRKRYPLSQERLNQLRGKDLACWCSLDSPCHVDVLLELANQE